jgi:hypothetical protein
MKKLSKLGIVLSVLMLGNLASGALVTIKVENLAPDDGVYLTPMWLGFDDGSFDLFTAGNAASAELEALAEDGKLGPLQAAFTGDDIVITGPGGLIGVPPVLDPLESNTGSLNVDGATNRFLTYAAMVIPSNDAFIGNDNAIEIFDAGGNFLGKKIIMILGAQVWDAGTEVNTEMDAAFINQAADGDGVAEGGVVGLHVGFIDSVGNPGGNPIILGGSNGLGANFDSVGADFTLPYAVVARITITPEPATLVLLGLGSIVFLRRKRFS